MTADDRRLVLAGSDDAADLVTYLRRLQRYEPQATVRLQARGDVVGVWARPPFGVLVLRAVRLAAARSLDVTVPAGPLARQLDEGMTAPELPDNVPGPGWAGLLPPQQGWQPVASAPAAPVLEAVGGGVRAFRTAANDLDSADRRALDALAAAVWDRPVLAEMPLRAAHAAAAMGFIGTELVTVRTAGSWLRLDGGRGSAFARRPGAPALRLA